MAFQIPKQVYSGKIGEVLLGSGGGALKVGGEEAYPFHTFEGAMANPPKIAMEVWDYDPSREWPAAAVEPFKDVMASPEAWAKKCVERVRGGHDRASAQEHRPKRHGSRSKRGGSGSQKGGRCDQCPPGGLGNGQQPEGRGGPEEWSPSSARGKISALRLLRRATTKGSGPARSDTGTRSLSSSPIDVNLAKQLNILLGNLGVKSEKLLIDPTTGGLGYGMEYSYSVMERIRMAALTQEDDKLQIPMISNVGNEIWKCKEAGLGIEEAPTLGDPEKRPILMETVAAVCYLLSGSNVVILRHPESVRLIKSFIDMMYNGGAGNEPQGDRQKPEDKRG